MARDNAVRTLRDKLRERNQGAGITLPPTTPVSRPGANVLNLGPGSCGTCGGAKWVYAGDSPAAEPCPVCWENPEAKEAAYRRRLDNSGLPQRFGRLEDFIAETEDQERAKELVSGWASGDWDNGAGPGLFLVGGPGTGKTHLCHAATELVIRHGVVTVYTPVANLMDYLRSLIRAQYTEGHESPHDVQRRLQVVPVLVLDDLGANAMTDYASETLYQIINYRYDQYLPTMVTTNVAPAALDDRLVSRLTDRSRYTQIRMVGWEDWRLR